MKIDNLDIAKHLIADTEGGQVELPQVKLIFRYKEPLLSPMHFFQSK